ncbi:hypothetical protein GYMLUDRAFT_46981 [Collybiopsis luxurians FD-317 M1]|uniref:Uncharacterized protein n=1 Tax=Collybiopsis luxurians FD-317 M1 TaxID=944289 RepID=A0A0D0B0S3_9AGAR|nr:hypothetical protein GYMLUDRAFT_46981 [Collybiopsis luxurians FD-317 M1]
MYSQLPSLSALLICLISNGMIYVPQQYLVVVQTRSVLNTWNAKDPFHIFGIHRISESSLS